jgi:hypothetical protein
MSGDTQSGPNQAQKMHMHLCTREMQVTIAINDKIQRAINNDNDPGTKSGIPLIPKEVVKLSPKKRIAFSRILIQLQLGKGEVSDKSGLGDSTIDAIKGWYNSASTNTNQSAWVNNLLELQSDANHLRNLTDNISLPDECPEDANFANYTRLNALRVPDVKLDKNYPTDPAVITDLVRGYEIALRRFQDSQSASLINNDSNIVREKRQSDLNNLTQWHAALTTHIDESASEDTYQRTPGFKELMKHLNTTADVVNNIPHLNTPKLQKLETKELSTEELQLQTTNLCTISYKDQTGNDATLKFKPSKATINAAVLAYNHQQDETENPITITWENDDTFKITVNVDVKSDSVLVKSGLGFLDMKSWFAHSHKRSQAQAKHLQGFFKTLEQTHNKDIESRKQADNPEDPAGLEAKPSWMKNEKDFSSAEGKEKRAQGGEGLSVTGANNVRLSNN